MHLAEAENRSLDGLLAAGSVDKRLLDRYGNKLLRLMQSRHSDFSSIDRGLLNPPLTAPLRKKLKACQVLVNLKAAELDIAPELLGRKKYLQELIRGFESSGQIRWEGELSGWRRQVLEGDITLVLMGENQDNGNGS
jgi:ribonuclease D